MTNLRAIASIRRPVASVGVLLFTLFSFAPLSPAEAKPPKNRATIKVGTAKLRSGPGSQHKPKALLDEGRAGRIVERQGSWVKVRLASGTEGWIRRDLVEVGRGGVPGAASASKKKKTVAKSTSSSSRRRVAEKETPSRKKTTIAKATPARKKVVASKPKPKSTYIAKSTPKPKPIATYKPTLVKTVQVATTLPVVRTGYNRAAAVSKATRKTVSIPVSKLPALKPADTRVEEPKINEIEVVRTSATLPPVEEPRELPTDPEPRSEVNLSIQTPETPEVGAPDSIDAIIKSTPAPRSGFDRSNSVIRSALSYRGTPYRMGATGRGAFDCSSFVQHVFAKNGKSLPRTAAEQARCGVPVAKSDLQVGDMVFFKNTYKRGVSHVGIYLGEGNFVHASSGSHCVTVSRLSDSYYVNHWAGARRLK